MVVSPDDPVAIEAFLTQMRIDQEAISEKNALRRSNDARLNEEKKEQVAPSTSASMTPANGSAPASEDSSPFTGICPPPPTPEVQTTSTAAIEQLPKIDEDRCETPKTIRAQFGESENDLRCFQGVTGLSPMAPPFNPRTEVDKDVRLFFPPPSETVRQFLNNDNVTGFQEQTLKKFREQAEARLASRGFTTDPRENVKVTSTFNVDGSPLSACEEEGVPLGSSMQVSPEITKEDADASHDLQDGSTAISHGAKNGDHKGMHSSISNSDSDSDSEVAIIVDNPQTPESFKSTKSALATTSSPRTAHKSEDLAKELDTVGSVTAVEDSIGNVAEDGQSREHATYFKSWGTAAHREGPAARVRKIVLTNFPSTGDYTLLQSLIHGGAVETMNLSPTTNSMTAQVVFVDADACDAYYNAYPNEIDLKYKGRKSTVCVRKGDQVDVVSSVLNNHLECGASRVVKVAGADEEWSMRALYKVAEGKVGHRKVEAILDKYSNESRTITFRFTNIADAVAFRGQLLRNRDWEDTDVQFAVDPCEKATGIHFE